jgi:hypothetical protein
VKFRADTQVRPYEKRERRIDMKQLTATAEEQRLEQSRERNVHWKRWLTLSQRACVGDRAPDAGRSLAPRKSFKRMPIGEIFCPSTNIFMVTTAQASAPVTKRFGRDWWPSFYNKAVNRTL